MQKALKTNFCQVTVQTFNDISYFMSSLHFPQYSTALANNSFPEVLGESKSKVKKLIWSEGAT